MKGQCLCGAVTVTAPDHEHVSACHCGMCRRWGGGPLLAIHCGTAVEIGGADKVKAYRSSDWAERAFCSECGTHLYYHLLPGDEFILSAGLFQDASPLQMTAQIFIDQKPGY